MLELPDPKGRVRRAAEADASRASRRAAFVKANPESEVTEKLPKLFRPMKKGFGFSWRKAGIMSPIKDQEGYNTCWAFAASGLMESLWFMRHHEVVDLAEQDLVNCTCRKCDGSSGSKHGEKRLAGIRREKANPYVGDGGEEACKASNCGPCMLNTTTPYHLEIDYIPIDADHTDGGSHFDEPVPVAAIKQAMLLHGPIYVKMHIPEPSAIGAFKGTGVFDETTPLIYKPKRNNGAHMVVLTGWDDDKGAWEVRNSWGTDWGNNGYGWIKYGSNKIGMNAVWSRMAAPEHNITAVWRKGDLREVQAHGWSYADYRERYDEIWSAGYRIESLDINVVDGKAQYSAVWKKIGNVAEKQVYGFSYDDYRAKYDDLWKDGWRLHLIEPYGIGLSTKYTAVWRKTGNVAEKQVYGKSYDAYREAYDELWKDGWRLHLLEPFVVAGSVKYTAVFRKGGGGEIQVYGKSYADYRAKYDQLWKDGWRLARLENYVIGGKTKYTAVWKPSTKEEIQVYGWDYDSFRAKDAELRDKGWRLKLVNAL
ncbi:MAG: hypothetical protein IAG13_02305 [Deltaproteobacteria bacterium]|nr:hypothetical protein [Nannocystaceae bacterium]